MISAPGAPLPPGLTRSSLATLALTVPEPSSMPKLRYRVLVLPGLPKVAPAALFSVPLSWTVKSPALQATVPSLLSVRPSRVVPPLKLAPPDAVRLLPDGPRTVPDVQSKTPLTTKLSVPLSMPLRDRLVRVRVTGPPRAGLKSAAPLTVSAPTPPTAPVNQTVP